MSKFLMAILITLIATTTYAGGIYIDGKKWTGNNDGYSPRGNSSSPPRVQNHSSTNYFDTRNEVNANSNFLCNDDDKTKLAIAVILNSNSADVCTYQSINNFDALKAEQKAINDCNSGKIQNFNCSTGTGVITGTTNLSAENTISFELVKGRAVSATFISILNKDCDVKFLNNPTQTTVGTFEVSCPSGFARAVVGKNKNDIKITAFRGDIYNKNTAKVSGKILTNINKELVYSTIIEGYFRLINERKMTYKGTSDITIYNYLISLLTSDCGNKVLFADIYQNTANIKVQEDTERAEFERLKKKFKK